MVEQIWFFKFWDFLLLATINAAATFGFYKLIIA